MHGHVIVLFHIILHHRQGAGKRLLLPGTGQAFFFSWGKWGNNCPHQRICFPLFSIVLGLGENRAQGGAEGHFFLCIGTVQHQVGLLSYTFFVCKSPSFWYTFVINSVVDIVHILTSLLFPVSCS